MNSSNTRVTDIAFPLPSFLGVSCPMMARGRQLLRFALILACLAVINEGLSEGQVPVPSLSVMEAIEAVLQQNPNLKLQQAQVQIAEGIKEQASGAFNPTLRADVNHAFSEFVPIVSAATGYVPGLLVTERSNITTWSVSSTKLYRTGISVDPSFQLQRTADSFLAPAGFDTQTSSVTVNIPLLQGRGRKVVAARETADEREIEASRLDLDFLISELTATAATDYWNVVAAMKSFDVARSAEVRAQKYVDNTQALIDANHVPRSDINQVTANLVQRAAGRVAAEQNLVGARQQLSLDMALSPVEILSGIGYPSDDFPRAASGLVPRYDLVALKFYLDQALTFRADYLAVKNRKDQASILLTAAKNGILPSLNLQSSLGYQSVQAGRGPGDYFGTPFNNARGPNATMGIVYSFPVGNQVAKGALTLALASARQQDARATQVAQGISEQIVVAVTGLRNADLRLRKTEQAIEFSEASLEGAREKYRVGIGSTVEILQIEDRLDTVLGDKIAAQLAYALSLVQFRLATGMLVATGQAVPTVLPNAIFTPPFGTDWLTPVAPETIP